VAVILDKNRQVQAAFQGRAKVDVTPTSQVWRPKHAVGIGFQHGGYTDADSLDSLGGQAVGLKQGAEQPHNLGDARLHTILESVLLDLIYDNSISPDKGSRGFGAAYIDR